MKAFNKRKTSKRDKHRIRKINALKRLIDENRSLIKFLEFWREEILGTRNN